MKSRRNQITIGVIALLVVGAVVFAIIYTQAKAQSSTSSLKTAIVKQGNIASTIATTGVVRTQQTATLTWQNTGTVGSVNVKAGDVVTDGQLLASLSLDQMPANVVSAEASLAADQQALDNLLNSTTPQAKALQALQKAQDALTLYQTNFPSTQAMAQANLVTAQYNLTTAQNKYANILVAKPSQADIAAAEATVAIAQQNADSAQGAYEKVSGLKPGDPRITVALQNLSDTANKLVSAQRKLVWYQTYPTAQDIDTAKGNLMAAQSAVASAQQAWDLIKDGPNAAQLAVLQAAVNDAQNTYNLDKIGPNANDVAAAKAKISADQSVINTMEITAPFNGTITAVSVLPRDQVSGPTTASATSVNAPGTTAFQIDDLSHLLIDVTVPETNIAKLKLNQPVNVTFNALPGKTYTGNVTDVAQVGVASQGVVTFGVTVEVTSADQNVLPGMTANVNIVIASAKNVLIVPTRAITTSGGQRTVTVIFEGNQISVPVTVGLASGTDTEITGGGLKVGDVVVVNTTTTTTNPRVGGFGGGGPVGPGGFGD
jgi:RND family efflux transporter MFP subunit